MGRSLRRTQSPMSTRCAVMHASAAGHLARQRHWLAADVPSPGALIVMLWTFTVCSRRQIGHSRQVAVGERQTRRRGAYLAEWDVDEQLLVRVTLHDGVVRLPGGERARPTARLDERELGRLAAEARRGEQRRRASAHLAPAFSALTIGLLSSWLRHCAHTRREGGWSGKGQSTGGGARSAGAARWHRNPHADSFGSPGMDRPDRQLADCAVHFSRPACPVCPQYASRVRSRIVGGVPYGDGAEVDELLQVRHPEQTPQLQTPHHPLSLSLSLSKPLPPSLPSLLLLLPLQLQLQLLVEAHQLSRAGHQKCLECDR